MKTKISHLGRSTVSVILAVMMLLSTMLIGTVSTVNAVTKTFEAVNLVGNINGNTKWDSTEYPFTFDETTGYWYLDITITQSSEFKARVNNGWDISFGASGGDNYTISESEIGDYRISVKDGSDNNTDLTVQKTVKKVADSVALTANPTSVKVGNSVTLTPTVSGAKSDNLTYTYKKTSDGTATEEKNADNSLTVTPTVAGTYKYTVTVSADGYSPVTSNEISFTATDSVKYYICGRFNTTWHDPSVDDPQFVEDESNPGLFYYETGKTIADLSGTISETYGDTPKYFYIYKTATNESTNYLTTSDNAGHNFQNNTVDRPLALSNKTGTDEKYLVRFNDDKDTSTTPVTIWLDTRNNEYKLWYTTALSHIVNVAEGVSATVDKATATTGEKVTVTAIPENGKVLDKVTVVGEDGSTPIETTVSGNTATFTMPDQNVTVTGVTFREANKYTVTFSSSDNTFGTVSATNGTTPLTSPATVTEGDTVTFTAKPKDGYALSGWTVNDASVSSTTNPYTITVNNNTTVTANFKVEDSGTIVNDMYFLYGSNNNPTSWEGQQGYKNTEYGKYDVYKKDGKYIVTLNEKHYKELYFAFSKDDSYVNMEPNTGLKPVNSENPEGLRLVDAKTQECYVGQVRYLFGRMSIESQNSEYIGDIKIIYDPTAKTYTVKATKDSASDTTVNIVGKDGTIRGGYYGKTTSALGDTTLKVTLPDSTTTITAIDSCEFDGKPPQGVTAKKVPYGSKVTVTTTIKPDATFAGHKGSDYYVKGFSINGFTGGVLTQQDGNAHTSDVYEYTFTVNKDVYADVSTIEITPIYFLKDDSDCVTFYVENFMDAKAKWGDTIACYAYYSDGDTSGNALGGYPGQPMVNAEGSIYMQIPKHIGDDASNVVKGITLNNYVWDFVHVSGGDKTRESKNCQTYDYDDFKYLANMSKVNSSDSAADIKNIVYRFKYHTYNNTSAEAGNVPKDTLTETKVDDTKYEVFVDYYDKPTDIFGTIIKGNDAVTVDTVKAQPEYLTIVSDGYVNYYKDTANYLGQYATKWYIYNKAGQQVAALPPSALLYGLTKSSTQLENLVTQDTAPADFMSDSGASTDVISGYWASFKSLYTKYAGKYAIINYESSIHSSGRDGAIKQPGERCDGRWYYSVDKAKITGDIKIEYADTLDSFTTMTGVKTDTFIDGTATGTNTSAEAYFTSPADQSTAVKPTHVETTSDNSENFKFTVGATSSTTSGYTFVGWYRLIDDTYKAVNDPSELNKTTGQVARNANVVLVARYIKTPGGSMTFHHSLYNGTNAGGGKAATEIQVVVKSSDGSKEYYNSGRIDSTASIDQKTISEIVADQRDAKITVTLYTTTKNLYNLNGYYSAENTTDITAFNPTTGFTTNVIGDRTEGLVTTSEYTFSFNDYYNNHKDTLIGDNAGTVYYNFYSDITSIKVPYKVQFSYTDRMGNQKYYNKAGYVDPENTSSYTFVENGKDVKVTLENSFILSLAPYESNFTKDLTWDETPVSNTAFDSSNSKSIASAVVKSTQSDRTIHLNVFRDNNGVPTPRTNTDGAFELFTRNNSPELPYGSVFYTKDTDGTYKYEITAPKTYKDKQFMYWAIYSDPDCKNLVINAYNSEGNFSYVAYDNCWIVPVYGESSTPVASVKDVYTSTQFMEVTRNQWTADTNSNFAGFDADSMNTLDTNEDFIKGNDEDKLYADFVLNFFYNGKQLSVFDPDSSKVQTGIVMQKLELEKDDSIGVGYNTDMEHYANKYINDLSEAAEDAKKLILTGESSIKSLTKQIDNKRLDNKNRLQYYARFNNTETNANCVYRVYTYIKYLDESNKPVVQLGNPIYFTLYDIANATV
ncbi:InlB B-repeat-containing protein [Ruminococcus bromii]|uniref:InlB B-repeat-containing protein n=1 Tax=Ruminococcus bromii TaxID=40518 RepID=UPI003FD7F5D0